MNLKCYIVFNTLPAACILKRTHLSFGKFLISSSLMGQDSHVICRLLSICWPSFTNVNGTHQHSDDDFV